MAADGIRVDVAGPVATLTIDREARRNALAPRHFEALTAGLKAVDADEAVRVVVLTGAGEKAFSAGADLSPGENFRGRLANDDRTGLGDFLRAARRLSKPLVGRVNGACVAGGLGLLAACDLAIATEGARFSLPEARIGMFPHVVLAGWRARLPAHFLAGLALTGAFIEAREVHRLGLVTQVAAQDRLDAATGELVDTLARLPAGLYPAARRALSLLDDDSFEAGLALAERAIRSMVGTAARGGSPSVGC